jgi:hypothetical protein
MYTPPPPALCFCNNLNMYPGFQERLEQDVRTNSFPAFPPPCSIITIYTCTSARPSHHENQSQRAQGPRPQRVLWREHLGQFVAFQRNVDFGGGVEGIRREHRAQKVFLKQNSVLTISYTTPSVHNYESLNVFNRNDGREILKNKRFNLFTKPTSHHTTHYICKPPLLPTNHNSKQQPRACLKLASCPRTRRRRSMLERFECA